MELSTAKNTDEQTIISEIELLFAIEEDPDSEKSENSKDSDNSDK
jgi:hypothetical protein